MATPTPLQRIQQAAAAYQEPCVLAAGAELDLFTLLLEQQNNASAAKLAELTGSDPRALAVLLDALTALGYLVKKDNSYTVADGYRELLDSRTPNTYIPMIRHLACVQRAWSRIAETVQTGQPQHPAPSILGAAEDRNSFIWAMNSVAGQIVADVVASLRAAGLLSFHHLLDLGGASGTYTVAFLRELPELRATIFDLPVGIAAARQRFTGSAYEARIGLVEGDMLRDDLPTGFDFVWVSAIIHQFDSAGCRAIYQKAYRALTSGGKIAIRDFIMNTDRTQPVDGALFGMNMLVETPRGQVYTFEEVRQDLEAAGFRDIRLAVPADTMSAIVTAAR